MLGEDGIAKIRNDIPMQRLATTDEIAKAVAFLSSPDNTYITGHNLIVDGGFSCV
jgi:3-oxoacyl-[acyl-carrier protein] reductase